MDTLAKADAALRSRLADTVQGDAPVVVILELDAPPPEETSGPLGGTVAATDRRRAARESAAEALASDTAATRAELERLGLASRGGQHFPFVIVQGPAHAIRAALELEGVVSATLDAPTRQWHQQE